MSLSRECRNCAGASAGGRGKGSWLCQTHAVNGNPMCVNADACCDYWRPYTEKQEEPKVDPGRGADVRGHYYLSERICRAVERIEKLERGFDNAAEITRCNGDNGERLHAFVEELAKRMGACESQDTFAAEARAQTEKHLRVLENRIRKLEGCDP